MSQTNVYDTCWSTTRHLGAGSNCCLHHAQGSTRIVADNNPIGATPAAPLTPPLIRSSRPGCSEIRADGGFIDIQDSMDTAFQIVSIFQSFPQLSVISASYPLTKPFTSLTKDLTKPLTTLPKDLTKPITTLTSSKNK